MSGDIEQHADTNSAEFKQREEARLNAGPDVERWKAGTLFKESSTPLFMRDSPEGNKGNAQDEKDETEE
jgi:hypothetical protein